MSQQVIWNEEYVRADAPARVDVMGEGLLGPTLIAYGTEAQKKRFLESHPAGAPSCGARATPSPTPAPTSPTCRPRRSSTATSGSSPARRCGPPTPSGPTGASWCAAPTPRQPRHQGLSYLLVPMDQPGIEVRPIRQMTGTARSSTRCSSTGPAPTPISWSARSTTAGGWPSPPWPSSGASGLLGDIVAFPQGARPRAGAGPQERAHRRPGDPPAPGRRRGSGSSSSVSTPCGRSPAWTARWPRPRPRSPSCSGPPGTATSASWPWTSSGPRPWWPTPLPYELSETCSASSCSAGPTPSTAGPTRSSATSSASASSGSPPSPRSPPPSKGAPTP